MKRIFLLYILQIFILSSCTQGTNNVSLNSSLDQNFSTNEIEHFEFLLAFFDNLVLHRTNTDDTIIAYHEYMENLKYAKSQEDYMSKLNVDKEIVISFFESYYKSNLFDSIYNTIYWTDKLTLDTVEIEYSPNHYARYSDLIDVAFPINPQFAEYRDRLWECGGICPTQVSGFQYMHEDLKLEYDLIKLLVAFHYTSLMSSIDLRE